MSEKHVENMNTMEKYILRDMLEEDIYNKVKDLYNKIKEAGIIEDKFYYGGTGFLDRDRGLIYAYSCFEDGDFHHYSIFPIDIIDGNEQVQNEYIKKLLNKEEKI